MNNLSKFFEETQHKLHSMNESINNLHNDINDELIDAFFSGDEEEVKKIIEVNLYNIREKEDLAHDTIREMNQIINRVHQILKV